MIFKYDIIILIYEIHLKFKALSFMFTCFITMKNTFNSKGS